MKMKKSKVVSAEVQDKLKKDAQKKSMEGQQYMKDLGIEKNKHQYITDLVNGRFFSERCNMIAGQLNEDAILESIDGCPKSLDYLRAEYAVTKVRAIVALRNAHFVRKDLLKLGLTKQDVVEVERFYYNGKIIKNEAQYEKEPGMHRKKAGFVSSKK